ncbi:hypothetical protein BH09BAC6_BH09BAC6_04880 [soil metagenome]
MKVFTATGGSLNITISPGSVYISTNPDQSSYANLAVTIQNHGTTALAVNSISITLPPALAPANGLNSITPVAGQPNLWNFGPSDYTLGEFDAAPVPGTTVTMNAGDTWSFTLQMVTLVSAIVEASTDVTVGVIFGDGTSNSTPLTIDILPAVASIISFNATPANINPGQSATLIWHCEKIDYCIISPIGDNQYSESGSLEVDPETTTIYTLYAYGDGVILSAQWAISVENAQIILFGGSDAQTSVNYGDNITLVWECNQYTVSIDMVDNAGVPISGLTTNGNTPQKGNVTVGPIIEPATFTLTAHGDISTNFEEQNAPININKVIYTLTADPDNGTWAGDNVTQTWNIENASAVSISPAIPNGPSLQNLSGSVVINPMADVTYVLTVSGFINNLPVLNQTLPVSLTVTPIWINSFTLSPAVIDPDSGSSAGVLQWDAQAEVVSINNSLGSQPASGEYPLSNPANGTVYTITAGSNQSPDQQTQSLTIANTFGPYTVNSLQSTPFGIDFVIPDPGPMNLLSQALNGDYSYLVTLTGIEPTGTAPPQYMALACYNGDTPTQSFFFVVAWPISYQTGFQWSDPTNPTGTLTITQKVPLETSFQSEIKRLQLNSDGFYDLPELS